MEPFRSHLPTTGTIADGDGTNAGADFSGAGSGDWSNLDPWQSAGTDWSSYPAWVTAPEQTDTPAACDYASASEAGSPADAPSPLAGLTVGSLAAQLARPVIDGAPSFGGVAAPATESSVGTIGSSALLADQLRSIYGVTGAGIKVGVLSDSFNYLGGASTDEADGALPSSVTVVPGEDSTGNDEGRAMLELVHQIAPGAQLYFATANGGDQNFAANIAALKADGCNVIIDDTTYYDEPMFQEGLISQAIDNAAAGGALYFTSAGNDATNAYQASWSSITPQTVTIGAGSDIVFDLQWNQPANARTTTLSLGYSGFGSSVEEVGEAEAYNGEPITLLELVNDSDYSITGTLTINNVGGPNPGLVKLAALGNGEAVSINDANAGTVFGHHEDPNAITVAAANSTDDGLEYYTSSGAGAEWLFNSSGGSINESLSKPDLTGVDGITTTLPYPLSNFYGTSAAAPTVGAVATLLMQLAPEATDAELKQALESTASNLGDPSSLQGAGLVNALAAGAALVPTVIPSGTETLKPTDTYALANLFFSSVQIGQISAYQVYEGSFGTPVGTITDGGTTLTPFQYYTVSSLSGLTYDAGITPGTDRLWVQAEANGAWSSWGLVQMTNTGAPVASVIGAATQSIGPHQTVSWSDLFSVSEASGDQITQYDVYEGSFGTPVGTITKGGVPLNLSQDNYVASLNGIAYNSSTTAGTDRLWLRAYADGAWGSWALLQMTNTGDPPPVTTALKTSETVSPDHGPVALTSLFSATEASSDTITAYNVYLGSFGTPVGTIKDANGNAIADFQNDPVTSLNGITYNSGTTAGTDRVWVQASVNGVWGNWALVQMVNTGPEAPVTSLTSAAIPQPLSITSGATLQLADLFSANDANGDPITQYDVYEGAVSGLPVGSVTDAVHNTLAPHTDNYYSSLSGLTYTASTSTTSPTNDPDNLWVRAESGGEWGNWALVQVMDVAPAGSGSVASDASQLQASQLTQAMAAFASTSSGATPSLVSLPPDPSASPTLASPHH